MATTTCVNGQTAVHESSDGVLNTCSRCLHDPDGFFDRAGALQQ